MGVTRVKVIRDHGQDILQVTLQLDGALNAPLQQQQQQAAPRSTGVALKKKPYVPPSTGPVIPTPRDAREDN